ncbi:MAG: hypothetical protein WBG66_06040 [Geitlerinemataceae cyanobacterium]
MSILVLQPSSIPPATRSNFGRLIERDKVLLQKLFAECNRSNFSRISPGFFPIFQIGAMVVTEK